MAYKTIVVDGNPWLVCEAPSDTEPKIFARKCKIPDNKVTVRNSNNTEIAKLLAERLLAEMSGNDPDKVFGTSL